MINHILVPLDGSALAECVLPHVEAIAPVTNARITVIHVLENPDNREGGLSHRPDGLAHAETGIPRLPRENRRTAAGRRVER